MNHALPVHLPQEAKPAEFPPVRNTPLRIAIEHNAEIGTGGLHRIELDGWAILITAVLTLTFASLTCWLWWSRAGSKDFAAIGLNRLGRKLRLSKPERAAVRRLADAAHLEPAALLLSTTVFEHCLERTPEMNRPVLDAVRTKLNKALGTRSV